MPAVLQLFHGFRGTARAHRRPARQQRHVACAAQPSVLSLWQRPGAGGAAAASPPGALPPLTLDPTGERVPTLEEALLRYKGRAHIHLVSPLRARCALRWPHCSLARAVVPLLQSCTRCTAPTAVLQGGRATAPKAKEANGSSLPPCRNCACGPGAQVPTAHAAGRGRGAGHAARVGPPGGISRRRGGDTGGDTGRGGAAGSSSIRAGGRCIVCRAGDCAGGCSGADDHLFPFGAAPAV